MEDVFGCYPFRPVQYLEVYAKPHLFTSHGLLDFRTFPWESGGSATRAGTAVAGGVVCAGVGVSR